MSHQYYVQPGAQFYTTPVQPQQYYATPASYQTQATQYSTATPTYQQQPIYAHYQNLPLPAQPAFVYGSPASTTLSSSPSSHNSPSFSPLFAAAEPEAPPVQKASLRAARRVSSSTRRSSVSHAHHNSEPILRDFLDHADNERPTYSVKALCEAALKGQPNGRMTLVEICDAITKRYPFFKDPEEARRLK